jgi:hypothetical protein
MKNLPKIQVIELTANAPVSVIINEALQIKTTGDANAVAPPVTDAILHAQANTLQSMYTGSKASPPAYTTAQVNVQKNIVITSYNKIVNYLKGVANDVAIAAGDVNSGNSVITRCGANLKKKGVKPPKAFSVVSKIAGSVDVSSKSVAPKAAYRRQYGVTTAKGIVPTVLSDDVITLEVDVHIDNLQSGKIYGFRETSVLPLTHKTHTGGTIGAGTLSPLITGKSATPTTSNKVSKVTFSDGAAHYVYSDWIYVVVK